MPLFPHLVFYTFTSDSIYPYPNKKAMTSILFQPFNLLSFFQLGNIFGSSAQASEKENKKVENEDASDYNDKIIKCQCCKWKGKNSETKKKFIFLTNISEVELFCPRCHKYISFISDQS